MTTYKTLITAAGRAKLAAKVLAGQQLVLTHMAVGDGAGNPVSPGAGQSELVREVYRRTLNALRLSPADPDTLIAEMVIPGDVGPFVVREAGLFDEDGECVAVANLPASTKPAPVEGATRDMVIQMYVKVANAEAVTIAVNPQLVIATRTWVDGDYVRMPVSNGTTGQLLRKKNNLRNEWEYYSPEFDASNFVFDAIEEPQTLAAEQTTVAFSTITTAGIAVYLETDAGGLRRLVRGDDYTITDETTIELATDYPADTRILGVQNDPNGNITPEGIRALARDNNLGDVGSVAAARENLQLAYATQAEAEAGSSALRVMSPLRVGDAIAARIASEVELSHPVPSNQLIMSVLRARQLIDLVIPAHRRGHDTGQIGLFYRRTRPSPWWLPLQGGTFGSAASGALYADALYRDLYLLWWSEFTQAELPVTGGRGASAVADWNANKAMALFNDIDQFYRVWNPAGARPFASLQADAFQGHRHSTLDGRDGTGSGSRAYNGSGATPQSQLVLDPVTDNVNGLPRTANETRPKNRNVLACVHI